MLEEMLFESVKSTNEDAKRLETAALDTRG